jgi:predicted DNA-binding transcriptional regulator AlpA
MIRGWLELQKETGIGYQRLRRLVALYGFPKPNKLREGRYYIYVWDKAEVASWLSKRGEHEANYLGPMGHDSTGR